MESYSLLAPLIAVAVIAALGIATLIWMNSTEPQLRRASARPEEGAPRPPFERATSITDGWHFANWLMAVRHASKRTKASTIPTATNVSYARPTKERVESN